MPGEMVAIVAILSLFGSIGFLIHVILRWRQSKYRLNVQLKMMDKIGNASDLVQLADTEGGKQFLDSLQLESAGTRDKILGAVSKGIILVILGVTLFLIRNIFEDASKFFVMFGSIALAFGIGYLVATGITYRLAKGWGMIDSPETTETDA